ncbi:hypothetical protein CSE16_12855 [Solibacillus sp. R5-41]|uniref:hypothetical protein n=1 Tax=Solibacillus sp. R5-41 TaxID=2048654 RepID=UPI000C129493|nr:hypothetical protein [Solibacillus sp. R5-41]ATP40861.1 hypothetical protein CSE16_12855 [Solibacillus sp. R5-41]
MSIVNYLGCNFIFPKHSSDESYSMEEGFLDDEDRKLVKKHFSTTYVYEIFFPNGVGVSFDAEEQNPYLKVSKKESQNDFLALCELLNEYLDEGDYYELYTCWYGEEGENRNYKFDKTIDLDKVDIQNISILEKTLITLKK